MHPLFPQWEAIELDSRRPSRAAARLILPSEIGLLFCFDFDFRNSVVLCRLYIYDLLLTENCYRSLEMITYLSVCCRKGYALEDKWWCVLAPWIRVASHSKDDTSVMPHNIGHSLNSNHHLNYHLVDFISTFWGGIPSARRANGDPGIIKIAQGLTSGRPSQIRYCFDLKRNF